jgi:hypothetical protein
VGLFRAVVLIFPLPHGETMQRANVLRAALVAGAAVGVGPVQAQTTIGADLNFFSSYVWRGLSLTNKPVFEPDLYLTIPAGNASITLGGWANIDLGKYDNLANDISESGGSSSFNFAEFDWWGEVGYPVGKATLTGGVTGYIYPNDANAPNGFGLITKAFNTVEVYGKAAFDVPLSPKLSIYYDVDKVKGAYFEGSVAHSLQASEKVAVNLGALAGFNAGQGIDAGDPSFNFADDGFTHLDLSAGVPFEAGAVSITPVLHLIVAGDDRTKVTSPTKTHDAKLWGGVTISWSRALGKEPEATEEPKP